MRLLAEARRSVAEGGEPGRALLVGAPSGVTIETLAAAGFRVSVDGEPDPRPPLGLPGETFDLVLAFDLPDLLEDEEWRPIQEELIRALVPGGVLWFLVGPREEQGPRRPRRWDLAPDGSLVVREVRGPTRVRQVRSNRDLERLAPPGTLPELTVRRDGYREVLVRRAARRRG